MIKENPNIPDMVVPCVLDVNFEELSKMGRRYYIFDLDNTLQRRDESLPLRPVTMKILHAQDIGWMLGMIIVSNVVVDKKWIVTGCSRVARVRRVAKQLRSGYVVCVLPILKPHPTPFYRAMEMMGARPEQTVVIGDQISKDIKGGNVVGALTILVNPLGPDMWLTAIIRCFKERGIRARLITLPGAT